MAEAISFSAFPCSQRSRERASEREREKRERERDRGGERGKDTDEVGGEKGQGEERT
jgi:hypothetical protein